MTLDARHGIHGPARLVHLEREVERLQFELKAKSNEIAIADEVIERLKRERDDEARLEAQDNHSALVGTKARDDALALRAARAECERDVAIAALKEVCDATAVPLPDPIAHSWRAFYDTACTRLTRCSNAARRGLRTSKIEEMQSRDGEGMGFDPGERW